MLLYDPFQKEIKPLRGEFKDRSWKDQFNEGVNFVKNMPQINSEMCDDKFPNASSRRKADKYIAAVVHRGNNDFRFWNLNPNSPSAISVAQHLITGHWRFATLSEEENWHKDHAKEVAQIGFKNKTEQEAAKVQLATKALEVVQAMNAIEVKQKEQDKK